jgi:hypothetical protein
LKINDFEATQIAMRVTWRNVFKIIKLILLRKLFKRKSDKGNKLVNSYIHGIDDK